jgi:hypothetical protein
MRERLAGWKQHRQGENRLVFSRIKQITALTFAAPTIDQTNAMLQVRPVSGLNARKNSVQYVNATLQASLENTLGKSQRTQNWPRDFVVFHHARRQSGTRHLGGASAPSHIT